MEQDYESGLNTEKESSHTSRRKAEAPFHGSSEIRAIRPLCNKMMLEKLLKLARGEREAWGQGASEAGLGQCQHCNTVWQTTICKNISPMNTDCSWTHSWVASWYSSMMVVAFEPLWVPQSDPRCPRKHSMEQPLHCWFSGKLWSQKLAGGEKGAPSHLMVFLTQAL